MAGDMDDILHQERLASGCAAATIGPDAVVALPSGAMVEIGCDAFAVKVGALLPWSFGGYGKSQEIAGRSARLITPVSIVRVLNAGLQPGWHDSADDV